MNATDLTGMSPRELDQLMRNGQSIDADGLAGIDYHGVSLGVPGWVERLSWRTFIKSFYRDADSGQLRGFNVRIRQDRPERYQPMTCCGRPRIFGHFSVLSAAGRPMPRPYHSGLLLDYSGVRRWQSTGALRDPLVAVHANSLDLLLGWSYLQLGPGQVPTPSYFSLHRAGRSSYSVR